jgi:hypothetical protein
MKATRANPLLRGANGRYPAQNCPGRNKNEEERLNLAFAVLPHIFLLKEESDEFFFSDIYTRGCFEGSQNPKKILKKLIAKTAAKKQLFI